MKLEVKTTREAKPDYGFRPIGEIAAAVIRELEAQRKRNGTH